MARFEDFQKKQVFDEKGEPLNKQIYTPKCIINFENGFIDDRYTELENGITPAITCTDGHMEYWEKGVLHKDDGPAVYSVVDGIEYWQNGVLNKKSPSVGVGENEELTEILLGNGEDAEYDFAKYLDKHGIPFIRLCQLKGRTYSAVLRKNRIKRPDYLIFIDKKPFFIEVKATGCYSIIKKELERLNALKKAFAIDVIFAVTEINKEEYKDFSFMSLDNLTNYIEIIIKHREYTRKWPYYFYPKSLLNDKIVHDDINNEELEKIYTFEGPDDKYNYIEILRKYFKDNNYKIEESKQTRT